MRHRWLLLLVALATGFVQSAHPQAFDESWKRISDREIGISVDYPSGIFATYSGPTDRHPGKRFRSADGAEFAYYAFDNKADESPSSYLDRTLIVEKRKLIYKRITSRFFVISSIRNGRIFYSRCNFGPRVKCIYLDYPAADKRAWDRAVTRVSHSLR
jgi:hypothetical protein